MPKYPPAEFAMRPQLCRIVVGTLTLLGLAASTGRGQELIYGMTSTGSTSTLAGVNLVSFNSTTPGTINTIGAFTGVVSGQSLHGIALQPTTNTMYAISSSAAVAQLYTVNLSTAALTPVGSGFTLTGNASNALTLSFNPVTNEIRVATRDGTNNNYRVSPSTGALLGQDTSFAWVAGDPNAATTPNITGLAHTNNAPGAASTTLYGWEYNTDSLVRIGGPGGTPSPNGGLLTTINTPSGALTFNAGMGMCISGATGTLYVSHDDPATGTMMNFYTRDLTTGAETLVGAYPSGTFIHEIAVFTPVPEPTVALGGAGLAGVLLAARRRKGFGQPAEV
jgi:hypothetical protein